MHYDISSVLVSAALKSTIILGAAWIATFLWRRGSAAARHLIWTAASVALLALPLLSVSLPSLTVPRKVLALAPVVTFRTDATSASDSSLESRTGSVPSHSSAPVQSIDWSLAILALWGAGTLAGSVQLILAGAMVIRLRRQALLRTDSEASALARSLGIARPVAVLQTARGTMPMTSGWLCPSVLLPEDSFEWSDDRRRAVLLHELAHVKRGDVMTQWIARAAVCVYWWNPLAWTAWREFLKMRERATDDLVLSAGARASDYAGHLIDVARSMSPRAAQAAAVVAMAQRSQLEGRVLAILDDKINRKSPGNTAAAFIALAALAVVASIAAIQAQDQSAQPLPADVDATIRAATGQKNFEMLDRVASAFEQAKQYKTEEQVLQAALAIRAQVAGERSPTYVDGLMKLGGLAAHHGKHAQAVDYYQRAIAQGDRPAVAPALLYLGMSEKDPGAAENYLQRAINADPKGSNVGRATMWLGVMQSRTGNLDQAEGSFSTARSMAAQGSPDEALADEFYADFLEAHNRSAEAEPIRSRAQQLRATHIAALSPKVSDTMAPLKLGDGITHPPGLVSKIEPEYSEEARISKFQGTVVLQLVIGTNGKAGNITLKRGIGHGLDEKAEAAVEQWRFTPGTRDGAPVPVIATIEVNFRLL